MSYTHPHGQPQGAPRKVTNLLRQVMIAEIVAINGYQTHILNSDITAINEAWYHIMLEEKSHYIIVLNLLRKYDPVEYKYFTTPHEINMNPEPVQVPQPVQNSHSAHSNNRRSSSQVQPARITYDKRVILNNVRDDIKGELEAVILYEDEIAEIQQKDIRVALQKIIDDEKEHTERLTQILLAFDPDPYNP